MGDIRILRNILMCCGSLHAMLSLPDICESSILAALVKGKTSSKRGVVCKAYIWPWRALGRLQDGPVMLEVILI